MDISTLTATVTAPHALSSAGSVSQSALPSDLVTERFNAMMSAAAAQAPSAAATSSHIAASAAGSLHASQTLGNQILAGLHSASTNYAQKWKNVTAGLDQMSRHPSAGSMLKVQSELLQVSLQYELVGKAVARSTQNIDTLVRMS